MRAKLKRNWDKPPLIPHKQILNAVYISYGVMAVVLLIIGIDAFVALFVPAAILAFSYFFVRLTP